MRAVDIHAGAGMQIREFGRIMDRSAISQSMRTLSPHHHLQASQRKNTACVASFLSPAHPLVVHWDTIVFGQSLDVLSLIFDPDKQ